MHRTLGAAHALLWSRCERVIQFVFDSFRLLCFHRLLFLWQVAFPQSCRLLLQVNQLYAASRRELHRREHQNRPLQYGKEARY